MLRFLRLLRLAPLAGFRARPFAVAKASAYSSILTFFPALLVVGSVLATLAARASLLARSFVRPGRILPAGSATAIAYLRGTNQRPVGLLITHLAADAVDRLRRHDFLDGRVPRMPTSCRKSGAC